MPVILTYETILSALDDYESYHTIDEKVLC